MITRIMLTTTNGEKDKPLGFEIDTADENIVTIFHGNRELTMCSVDEYISFIKDANKFYESLKRLKLL